MMAIMMKVLEYLLVIVVWKVLGDWSRLEYGDQRHHRNVVVDDVCGVLAIVVPWSPSCLQLVLIIRKDGIVDGFQMDSRRQTS